MDTLVSSFGFRIISDTRFQPGIRVMKPSGRFRSFTSPLTGETKPFAISDNIKIDQVASIPAAIAGLEHFSVLMSGEWSLGHRPLALLTCDGVPFEENYTCEVSCHLRPEPVSTSCLNEEAGPRHVGLFGEPCQELRETGIFTNPWSGEVIEVPNAGCARFWIELEFGKFIFPRIVDSFDVLNPSIIAKTEECFQTRFVQGYRFN